MLILSRKVGQSLILGEEGSEVVVTLMGIKQNQARIGVMAPKEMPVHREEVIHRIRAGEVKINGRIITEADPDKLEENQNSSRAMLSVRNSSKLKLKTSNRQVA